MRTTVRIEDDLLRELKARAQQEDLSLTQMLNRIIRRGLVSGDPAAPKRRKFRQKTYAMGKPLVDLTKALALSAAMEDEAIIEKLTRGK